MIYEMASRINPSIGLFHSSYARLCQEIQKQFQNILLYKYHGHRQRKYTLHMLIETPLTGFLGTISVNFGPFLPKTNQILSAVLFTTFSGTLRFDLKQLPCASNPNPFTLIFSFRGERLKSSFSHKQEVKCDTLRTQGLSFSYSLPKDIYSIQVYMYGASFPQKTYLLYDRLQIQ